jgi:DNA-binding HxlR family transcriptional regulator
MKRYGQYCPIAHALEVVGERWSLLIVRDLLKGPRRYTDLAEGLPGIGTNILAGRLRDLEAAGIVAKRKLAPPASAVTVYELTEYGLDLEEAIQALARWGARTIGPPESEEELTPGWSVDALRALFNPFAAAGIGGTYVLRIADDVTTVRVEDGSLVEVHPGAAEDADLVLETDFATFYELMVRTLAPEDALVAERVRIDGSPEELERLVSVLSLEPRYVAARPTLV